RELDGAVELPDAHDVRGARTEPDVHPLVLRVPERAEREPGLVEVGMQLAVDDNEAVSDKRLRHARAVVVRGFETRAVLDEVDAGEDRGAVFRRRGDRREELGAPIGLEVADRAAEERDEPPPTRRNRSEMALEVADDRVDADTLVPRGDRMCTRAQH